MKIKENECQTEQKPPWIEGPGSTSFKKGDLFLKFVDFDSSETAVFEKQN